MRSGLHRVSWANGAQARVYPIDRLDDLRGFRFDTIWLDDFDHCRGPGQTFEVVSSTLMTSPGAKMLITTTLWPAGLSGMLPFLREQPDVLITYADHEESKDER